MTDSRRTGGGGGGGGQLVCERLRRRVPTSAGWRMSGGSVMAEIGDESQNILEGEIKDNRTQRQETRVT